MIDRLKSTLKSHFWLTPVDGLIGQGAHIRTEFRHVPVVGSHQFVEQRPRLLKVRRGEAFGEPVVNRREQVVGFGMAAQVAPQPGEAGRGTHFQSLACCSRAMLRALRYSSSAASVCPC